ncbi:transcriptional regulator of RNA polII, SAGA, subunit-domain-containing protein [Hyaloraphidium curvatum]|nr:transcriptional regulator of RNA polII, SAGA, subunit-domain-containing protein [Hyaloraphidium curvatum]
MQAAPPPAAGPPEPLARRDTLALKKRLEEELGDYFGPYWRTLSAFLTGRLSKRKFDEAVGPLLSFRLRPVHNQLVFAIHHNAQRYAPPTPPTVLGKRKEVPQGADDGLGRRQIGPGDVRIDVKKDAYGNPIVITLTPAASIARATPKYHDTQYPVTPADLPDPSAIPPTCVQQRDLPSRDLLRQRIAHLAHRESILPDPPPGTPPTGAVTERAVELVDLGMQTFLQNILSTTMRKVHDKHTSSFGPPASSLAADSPSPTAAEPRRPLPIRKPSPPPRPDENNRPNAGRGKPAGTNPGPAAEDEGPKPPPRIALPDLFFALRTRPVLLGRHGAEVLERCVAEMGVREGEEGVWGGAQGEPAG